MGLDTDVIDVVGKFLNGIKRSGPDNLMAICPFHVHADGRPETGASFAISTRTGLWMCHSCHEKGNLRSFLRDIGVPAKTRDTFYRPLLDAVEERVKRQYKKTSRIFNDLVDNILDESFLGLFEHCPIGLLEEGFSEETLKHFDIGYDIKSDRVTFPIRDIIGRTVGISGRSGSSEVQPRYKIYSKTEYEAWSIHPIATDKSRFLWNADRVYPEAWLDKAPAVLVVEGFKACMWAWQAGFKNVVALMGSFPSNYQLSLLERMGGVVYLFLDSDEAGQCGTAYASRVLSYGSVPVRIVPCLEKQPTDLSLNQVQEAVSKAVNYGNWV
jgi:DNA primase